VPRRNKLGHATEAAIRPSSRSVFSKASPIRPAEGDWVALASDRVGLASDRVGLAVAIELDPFDAAIS
jgi:hypothetical protein